MGDDGPSPDDVIKILVTSDNHVGYNEKDEIRGGDSFHTFEEVLKIACDEKVRLAVALAVVVRAPLAARSPRTLCSAPPRLPGAARAAPAPPQALCTPVWLAAAVRAAARALTSAIRCVLGSVAAPRRPRDCAQVDMILNGGDLFHDNKPSRRTLVRAAPARSLPACPAPTPLS